MGKKSLADLYVRGKDLTLGEGDEAVTVWVQKLNPVEHTTAVRKAEAARARVLSAKFDKDGDDYQALLNDVLDTPRPVLIELLASDEERRITAAREAQVADGEKWKKDNYLDGLREAWADSLWDKFVEDPDDAEAKRVKAELDRFIAEVRAEIDREIESFKISLSTMSDRELIDSAMENRLKTAGDVAWVNEYHRQEVALGTRDAKNHRERLFAHRGEIDELQAETYLALVTAFRELTVEPTEGKGSAAAPPSSTSSEPSAPEGTSPSSGPEA